MLRRRLLGFLGFLGHFLDYLDCQLLRLLFGRCYFFVLGLVTDSLVQLQIPRSQLDCLAARYNLITSTFGMV